MIYDKFILVACSLFLVASMAASDQVVYSNFVILDEDLARSMTTTTRFPDIPEAPPHFVDALHINHCGNYDSRSLRRTRSTRGKKLKASKRLFNGTHAVLQQFPSYVRLELHDKQGTTKICGGTLLSRDLVLTAGHCMTESVKKVAAIGGQVDKRGDQSHKQIRWAKGYCHHPDYAISWTHRGSLHDLAVFHLDKPFDFNSYIQPACLLPNETHRDDEIVYTVGFGQMNERLHFSQSLDYQTMKRCQDKETFSHFYDHQYNTCYQSTSSSNVCPGDSGSGVMLNRGSKQYIVGVVSFKNIKDDSMICSSGARQASYVDLYKDRDVLNWMIKYCYLNRTNEMSEPES